MFVGFKRWTLNKDWHRHQVQTVRWRLYQTAANSCATPVSST
jgi:hypothetical protein